VALLKVIAELLAHVVELAVYFVPFLNRVRVPFLYELCRNVY